MLSNTLGHKTEITFRTIHGNRTGDGMYILEIRKTDTDTWLVVTWEARGDKEINKQALTIHGDQLREIIKNGYMFQSGG